MYFITCIAYYPEHSKNGWGVTHNRCFGYYKEFPTIEWLRHFGDECLYNYLVIENFGEGIHPEAKEIFWYICNEKREWEPIELDKLPEQLRCTINWGIG